MASASCLLIEDQFLCSICLDVFTDPVSTPCGHNFCKSCISQHWDVHVRYDCPNCKEVFQSRPKLKVNIFISEMVARFRQSAQQKARSSSSRSEQQVSNVRDVSCDFCTGTKVKALKSCLVCLASYCHTHLEPHLTIPGLKRHQLIFPVEAEVKLRQTETEIQLMIQERLMKIVEIKRSAEQSHTNTDRETTEVVQVFTSLTEAVKGSFYILANMVKEKQRETQKQAEGFIKELQQEISELEKRSSEVEQLLRSENNLHLLQNFSSLNTAPPTKDWTGVRVHPPSYDGTVVRAVKRLEETTRKKMEELIEAELQRVQHDEEDQIAEEDRLPWLGLEFRETEHETSSNGSLSIMEPDLIFERH